MGGGVRVGGEGRGEGLRVGAQAQAYVLYYFKALLQYQHHGSTECHSAVSSMYALFAQHYTLHNI